MVLIVSELLESNRAADEKCCPAGYEHDKDLDSDFSRCVTLSREPVPYHNIKKACAHVNATHFEPKNAVNFKNLNNFLAAKNWYRIWIGAEMRIGRWYWQSGHLVPDFLRPTSLYCKPEKGKSVVDFACCMIFKDTTAQAANCEKPIHALCTLNLEVDGVDCNSLNITDVINKHSQTSNMAIIVTSISLVLVLILVVIIIVYILRHSDDKADITVSGYPGVSSATVVPGSEVTSDTDTSGTNTPS